jgi:hypothetical protein
MSSIANLTSTPALPQLNIHSHGHKKGSHVESADDSGSDTAAPVPAGTQQNLFGSLLQSLEQVIGVQLSAAAPAGTASATAAASPAGGAAAASQNAKGPQNAGSKVNVLA